tara:strand:+ start:112 stop:558 length:447 start_codon:yes stop_codon:yes gene_type:complete
MREMDKEWIDDNGFKIVDKGEWWDESGSPNLMRTIYRPEKNLSLPPEHPRRKDDAGTKYSEGKMKGKDEDGLWTGYYITGEKSYEGTYKDGKEDGKWTYYFIDGNVMSEEVWEDGELFDEKGLNALKRSEYLKEGAVKKYHMKNGIKN